MSQFSPAPRDLPDWAFATRARIRPNTDYAVVAGLDVNGLGVVRALASAAVPVVALDTSFDKPTAATRHGTKVRVKSLSGEEFITELLRLRPIFDTNPILFLTQEAGVQSVSARQEKLAGAYRFSLPSHALMENLLDKIRFQALAERLGFPVPRALKLPTSDDSNYLSRLRFPCVLKPAMKNPEYGQRFAKAYKVADAQETIRLWHEVRSTAPRIIVQEWIEGGDSDVYFCLQYRTATGAVASFAGRKLCQWPPLVGGAASCIPAAADISAELTCLTDRFFTAVGFVGICSMEYKRDRRDGRFYLIEPTVGRTDYQEEIAALNGINIPFAAFQAELGLPAPPPPNKPNRQHGWRDSIGIARARQMGARDSTRELAPNMQMHDVYFRYTDPMPYVSLKFQPVRNRWAKIAALISPNATARVTRIVR